LGAVLLAAGNAGAESSAPKPYDFWVFSPVAGTPVTPTPAGTTRRLQQGDVVFEAPMRTGKTATLQAPLEVKVAGLDFSVTSYQSLNWATRGSGGDLASLPSGAPMLCSADYGALVDVASDRKRYNKWAVLCLVDSDSDGSVDKAFTNASKLPADWHMVDVTPTAYRVRESVPLGSGASIKVVYVGALMFRPVGLQAEPWVQGSHDRFTWAKLVQPDGTMKGRWPFKGPYPQRIELGEGVITLLSFDPNTKVAEIRYERDFAPVGFVPESDRPDRVITIYH
jgi:hypothetical protein